MKTVQRACFIAYVCCLVVIGLDDGRMAAQAAPDTRTVLLLRQSDVGGSISARFDTAFADALRADKSRPIELYTENIESERFPGPEHERVFTSYLTKKYAGRPIDVIVVQGFEPLEFARQHRALFGNPPIVTTVATPRQLNSNDNVIGLQGGFWVDETHHAGAATVA